jgi:hypothetical protein
MPMSVGRDPFARGEYRRECQGPGTCAWCGDKRRRVFTYVWINDDSHRPSIFAEYQRRHAFCNFACFLSYHS